MRIIVSYTTVLLLAIFFLSCTQNQKSNKVDLEPVDYVNTKIGGISHLLVPTFPTVHLPNSMLRVYPERADYTGDLLHGLPLVVTSHRGSSAFNLSPFQGGDNNLKPVVNFSYDLEKITPFSYSVYLDEQKTEINYAVSHQAALYEMIFSKNDPVSVIINTRNGAIEWDGKAVSGYQNLQNDTRVYIYLETDIKPQTAGALQQNKFDEQTKIGRAHV